MRKVWILEDVWRHEGERLRGVYETEAGARTYVYEQATSWEGRLLWWPLDDGGWHAQMLMRDFLAERGVRYRFRLLSWRITPMEPRP